MTRSRRTSRNLCILLAVCLGGCGTGGADTARVSAAVPSPARTYALDTHEPGNFIPEMLVNFGVLRATPDGCPYLDGGAAGDFALVWPPGWTGSQGDDGRWTYRDSAGTNLVREGETPYFVGGGELGVADPCGVIDSNSVFKIYLVNEN